MSKLTNNNVITVGKNDPSADFNTADFIAQNKTDWDCIVAAYQAAKVQNIKTVFVKNGTYNVKNGAIQGSRLNPESGINLIGESRESTIIEGGRNGDWMVINRAPITGLTYVVNGFLIKNMTFNLADTTTAGGLRFENTDNTIVENVCFKNGAAGGWLLYFGSRDPLTITSRGNNNKDINCIFDRHQGSLEMTLLYNQNNYESINATYKNKGDIQSGPTLGLWQNCEGTRVINPRFLDNKGFGYYSVTCDNTYIENIYAKNSGTIFEGANVSDNTEFGPSQGKNYVKGLTIKGLIAIGGINSINSTALQIAAVQDYNLEIDYIEGYEIGINFNRGNNQNYSTPYKGYLKLGTIKNCNPNNNFHDIHPGIYFSAAGEYDLVIEGGEIYDDRTTPFQRLPISFNESHVEPVLTYTLTTGVITAVTITNGGGNLPRSRTATFPLVIPVTDGAGTGAVINAITNSSGTITSINIISGGAGYVSPITSQISTFTFSNIRIKNSKLISYAGNSSITKLTTALLGANIEFDNIRNPVKGSLSSNYDSGIVASLPIASVTQAGVVSIALQDLSGRKGFVSNDTFFGTGITNPNSAWLNIGNLGTTDSVYLDARSTNVANVNIKFNPKGLGTVQLNTIGEYKELKLGLTPITIAALTVGTTATLFTVPATRTLVITKTVFRPTTVTGTVTTAPQISTGGNATTFDDFMINQTFTGAILQGTDWTWRPVGAGVTYPAGTIITTRINAAQVGATVLTYTVDLFGYLI